jgi:1-acyl-sn-glycerol-3-phosphate acyltransferase
LPVYPGAITGSEDELVVKRLRKLKRLNLDIKVGDPFTIPPLPKENREDALKIYTDEIMCQIAALLPPEYRGVYADHPRLRELLSSRDKTDKEVSPTPV